MARPRKPDHETRKRWDALYVTTAERDEITAAAKMVQKSVSQYLLASHRGGARRQAQDTTPLVHALITAERQLALLSRTIADRIKPVDALVLQASLMALERDFRCNVFPCPLALNDQGEGSPSC